MDHPPYMETPGDYVFNLEYAIISSNMCKGMTVHNPIIHRR